MKYKCELMRDLMPLVKDGISSEPSAEAVNEHIEECEECRKYYLDISENTVTYPQKEEENFNEIKEVAKYGERIKKHRRKVIIIVTSVIGVFLLFYTIIIKLIIGGVFTFGHEFKTEDISQYGIYSGHIEKEKEQLTSYLMVFPKTLPHSAKVEDYYYFCSSKWLDNTYQIYLEYTLDKIDYVAEVKRLSEISIKYKRTGAVNNIIYDTTGFNYPAYITIFDSYNSFEYALTDDINHKIVCVYSQRIGIDAKIVDAKYRSNNFTIPTKYRAPKGQGYNMYYFPLDDNARIIPREGEFD
jgi:hypothetical protein